MSKNLRQLTGRRFLTVTSFALLHLAAARFCAAAPEPTGTNGSTSSSKKHVAVLSAAAEPAANTSQGCYINILREAGFEARAITAEEVQEKKLEGIDIFIIGGGSGTAFNKSLGPEGGKIVQEFVRKGGGAMGSCAGGYAFVNGHNEALKYISIAKANTYDFANNRWARGEGVVEVSPADGHYRTLNMFYANGPLWTISPDQGSDHTVALAKYKGDIKKGDDPGGVMPGTPAILGGTFGDGRYVLFSAHPEFKKGLGNNPLVADAARWIVRGRLKPGEAIRFEDVFPDARKAEAGEAKPAP